MEREPVRQLKRTTRRATLKATAGLALAAGASGSAGGHGREGSRDEFEATLSPDEAVPPEYEPAPCGEGAATFRIRESEERIDFDLRLDDVQGVSGIHLHRGTAGENGPHVAEIFNGEPTGDVGDFFSLSATGSITADDRSHEFDGSFGEVVDLIREGRTYLQVHRGEEGTEVIRGALE